MRRVAVFLAAVMVSMAAHADGLDEFNQQLAEIEFTNGLASLIASEEACGLAHDQDTIAALVAERVDPARLDFADNMRMRIRMAERDVQSVEGGALTLHCAAIEQTARAYGMIE